jgi:putative methyltransferase (TIGR04325 family)
LSRVPLPRLPMLLRPLSFLKRCAARIARKPALVYAPAGWDTPLPANASAGWNAEGVVTAEKAKWEAFCAAIDGSGPLGFSHEHTDLSMRRHAPFHNIHITYGYVLALASQGKSAISVLDYGGGLGHYYQIARALVPDVEIDFCCKEVPAMAAAGEALNPQVRWCADDTCLTGRYDVVMINGSLQYMREWRQLLARAAAAAGGYLLLTRVPVVESSDAFVAVQNAYGTRMLHAQFNKTQLLRAVEDTGLQLVRELVVGDRPLIKNAPEQCELRGWLFRRERAGLKDERDAAIS